MSIQYQIESAQTVKKKNNTNQRLVNVKAISTLM